MCGHRQEHPGPVVVVVGEQRVVCFLCFFWLFGVSWVGLVALRCCSLSESPQALVGLLLASFRCTLSMPPCLALRSAVELLNDYDGVVEVAFISWQWETVWKGEGWRWKRSSVQGRQHVVWASVCLRVQHQWEMPVDLEDYSGSLGVA